MNVTKTNKSRIIFLRGVFLADCETFNDKFRKHVMAEVAEKIDTQQSYDTIPKEFTTLEIWPKSTNIKCWSCTLNFSTRPIFVPGRNIKQVNGNFCSFNCAAAWINLQTENVQWEMRQQLKELYYIFNGKRIDVILPAHDKTEMKEYGGMSTRVAYIKKNAELDTLSINTKFPLHHGAT